MEQILHTQIKAVLRAVWLIAELSAVQEYCFLFCKQCFSELLAGCLPGKSCNNAKVNTECLRKALTFTVRIKGDEMCVEEKSGVAEFLVEARSYHKTVVNGWSKRRGIFTADICYNLLGISIEKYFMAFLVAHDDMADNHTFTDLINSYERTKPFPKDLTTRLQKLEALQNLCPLADAFSADGLSDVDIKEMIEVTDLVQRELGYTIEE